MKYSGVRPGEILSLETIGESEDWDKFYTDGASMIVETAIRKTHPELAEEIEKREEALSE